MAARKRGAGTRSGGRKTAKTPVEDARARMYRELLFATGEAEFGANGFTGTTMQQIASAAGVSIKTLYAYYPSKTALYEEVMQVRASAFVEAVSRGLESADDPVERIEGGVRAYVEFLFEHEQWLQIHLRDRVSWSLIVDGQVVSGGWNFLGKPVFSSKGDFLALPARKGKDWHLLTVRIDKKGVQEGMTERFDAVGPPVFAKDGSISFGARRERELLQITLPMLDS